MSEFLSTLADLSSIARGLRISLSFLDETLTLREGVLVEDRGVMLPLLDRERGVTVGVVCSRARSSGAESRGENIGMSKVFSVKP